VKSIGPAVIVVPDDALANARPFLKIFRRSRPIRFDIVEILYRNSQSVENFTTGVDKVPQKNVRKSKIV